MIKTVRIFVINLLVILAFCLFANFTYSLSVHSFSKPHAHKSVGLAGHNFKKLQQENHPPVVKITAPRSNTRFECNATVPYTISVSDPEDGESEYQEINSNEVYLEVKFVADATKAAAIMKQASKTEPAGLTAIKGSNCFNCHTLNTKLIGPSFYDISKKYPITKANTEKLIKHIREGSTGVWGDVSMPSHPELTQQEMQSIVQWMYKNGAQPGLNFYRGLEGAIRPKSPTANQKGVFILTASYTDHGTKDQPKQTLRGQDVVLISCGK